MYMKYVFVNLYAYEVHNDQGIIKSKYQTFFNTADGAQGGRNFVQVHINITDKKVELLSINKEEQNSAINRQLKNNKEHNVLIKNKRKTL